VRLKSEQTTRPNDDSSEYVERKVGVSWDDKPKYEKNEKYGKYGKFSKFGKGEKSIGSPPWQGRVRMSRLGLLNSEEENGTPAGRATSSWEKDKSRISNDDRGGNRTLSKWGSSEQGKRSDWEKKPFRKMDDEDGKSKRFSVGDPDWKKKQWEKPYPRTEYGGPSNGQLKRFPNERKFDGERREEFSNGQSKQFSGERKPYRKTEYGGSSEGQFKQFSGERFDRERKPYRKMEYEGSSEGQFKRFSKEGFDGERKPYRKAEYGGSQDGQFKRFSNERPYRKFDDGFQKSFRKTGGDKVPGGGWDRVPREKDSTRIFTEIPTRFRLNHAGGNLTTMDYERRGYWSDLNIPSELQDGLNKLGITVPNPMQMNAISELIKPSAKVLYAAETGSGKTLAYLLPILHKLKLEEVSNPDIRIDSHPRAIILVPSNELVNQVYKIAKHLAHHVKLRVEMISGTHNEEERRRSSIGPVDLVIGTPAQILSSAEDGLFSLGNITHISIDEADTLLSDDFGEDIKKLLTMSSAILDTLAICSATIPVSLTNLLESLFPQILRLGSPKLHTASDRVDIRFVDVQLPGNAKIEALEELLMKNSQKTTLVFCNTAAHATRLHLLITEHTATIEALPSVPSLLHGAIPEAQRQSVLKNFQTGEIRYLICTDLASRGLDTTHVGHVIMYDFPRNPIDFIHRAGRTGRLEGTRGLVTCLVGARDEQLAKAIKQSVKSGLSLT
jgi:superfamily II DNA/RNA helicase